MHICIIGTGAAGWITAFKLKNLHSVDHITIIGSPSIPTIGVGESTTCEFPSFLHTLSDDGYDMGKLLIDIDASVKYGVYYKDWSKKEFLHAFVGSPDKNDSGYLLGSLDKSCNENYYMMPMFDEIIHDHRFNFDSTAQNYSFHFDANKLISSLERFAKTISNITHLKDTVVDCKKDNGVIHKLILEESEEVKADYYVNCIGQTAFNQKVFDEVYHDYSDVLLTDKALFYPLPYTNKEKEFHPYTVAKAMKYGWRWITPTWSRIGTGYVFSSKYITVEEAKQEFCEELGDHSIDPFVTDFYPRRVDTVFKDNYCTIGMAAGFLEPLDAPGLDLTMKSIILLSDILTERMNLKAANECILHEFNTWACFILHQYKTSTRNDTDFWIDHKNVNFEYYDAIINSLFDKQSNKKSVEILEPWMFYNTAAGKGQRWKVKNNSKGILKFLNKPKPSLCPQVTDDLKQYEFGHLEFFNKLHESGNF